MHWKEIRCPALAVLALVASLDGTRADIIGTGPISVGLTPVEMREDKPTLPVRGDSTAAGLSAFIARNVSDLLPNYLQRSLERAFERQVSITSVPAATLADGSVDRTLNAIISPTVENMGPLGVRVSAKIVLRPEAGDAGPQLSSQELFVLSPNADFGEIDEKVSNFGVNIARRLTELSSANSQAAKRSLPHGIMAFSCISAADPGDRKLQQLARILTIEFPHHLSEAGRNRGLEVIIRGLDLKEVVSVCEQSDPGNTSRSTRPEAWTSDLANFTWTGTIARDGRDSKRVELALRVKDRYRGGNFRPLPPVTVADNSAASLSRAAEQVVESFVAQYAQGN
jgi:hypothetical protein